MKERSVSWVERFKAWHLVSSPLKKKLSQHKPIVNTTAMALLPGMLSSHSFPLGSIICCTVVGSKEVPFNFLNCSLFIRDKIKKCILLQGGRFYIFQTVIKSHSNPNKYWICPTNKHSLCIHIPIYFIPLCQLPPLFIKTVKTCGSSDNRC